MPWDWRTYGEYLDRLDGTLAPNAGFLVGHSDDPPRRDGRATRRGADATPGEQDEMERLLAEGLAAGGLGFSSSWATTHNDADGDPVPSRHASTDELLALCEVVSAHPGTTLEFIPRVGLFEELRHGPDDAHVARREPAAQLERAPGELAAAVRSRRTSSRASDYAAERGARVLALTMPDSSAPASRSAAASCSTC